MAAPLVEFLKGNAPWLTAGALLTFLSSFGQTFFISLFAADIRTDYGLSHGQWGLMYSTGTFASAIVMVWAGVLTDKFRARSLGQWVLVGLALACLFMAFNAWVTLLPLVIFFLRLTGQGMTSHIAIVAMGRWFVATRGKALATATLGFAAGEALLPILFVSLLAFFDWRVLWVISAALALAGIPILRRLLKTERTPSALMKENSTTGMQDRHWTRVEALRHPLIWFMAPALLGPSACNTAFFFQQVHFADVKDMSHLALVALFPIYTVVSIAAMILFGFALDRFGTARLIPFSQLPMVAAFLGFAWADSVWGIGFGLAALAIATGATATLPNAFWAEFYGTKNLGSVKSMATAIMVLGSAIGPGITGLLIDAGVSINTQYVSWPSPPHHHPHLLHVQRRHWSCQVRSVPDRISA